MRSKVYTGLLISKSIRVVESTDKCFLGLKGRIVDETKNILVLEHENQRTSIPKHVVSFEVTDESGNVRCLAGSDLIGTPQERINRI